VTSSYSGRPLDDPDGEAAALLVEQADAARERAGDDELAWRPGEITPLPAHLQPAGRHDRPVTVLDREGALPLEWCEVHQRRHMAPGFGDPEPRPTMPAGAYLAFSYPPRTPRIAIVDPTCGRELAVITWQGGKVCASYDDDDLDAAARVLLDRMVALGLGELDIDANVPLWHEAHTFDCAHAYAHGTCPSALTTQAGHVGPWRQLYDRGWRRNGSGAWECPSPHVEASR
jgi:hypothetical protein